MIGRDEVKHRIFQMVLSAGINAIRVEEIREALAFDGIQLSEEEVRQCLLELKKDGMVVN